MTVLDGIAKITYEHGAASSIEGAIRASVDETLDDLLADPPAAGEEREVAGGPSRAGTVDKALFGAGVLALLGIALVRRFRHAG